jgi:hypothetical protein
LTKATTPESRRPSLGRRARLLARNASRCILLSATPYNKAYLDLANQLRLFMNPDDVAGIRPEEYLRRDCDGRPGRIHPRHQCAVNCLSAFEKSEYADDWRELMRLFMVRRTRSASSNGTTPSPNAPVPRYSCPPRKNVPIASRTAKEDRRSHS